MSIYLSLSRLLNAGDADSKAATIVAYNTVLPHWTGIVEQGRWWIKWHKGRVGAGH